MRSAYTTLAVHRTDVDMAPRSAGRTSNPNKPGYFNMAFEQTNDHHQYHEEEFKEFDITFKICLEKIHIRKREKNIVHPLVPRGL